MSATAAAPGPAAAVPAARSRAVYSRVAAFGLLLLAAAPIMMLVIAVASGMTLGPEGVAFAVTAVLAAGTAALVWRFGAWSKILAIVVALLVAGAGFFVAFGLAFPSSFGDFVPAMAFVSGFLLTLGGAIAALVQGRRGNVAAAATPRERRIILVAGAILAVGMAISAVMTFMGGRAAADAEGTPVSMADFTFPEGTYTVAADEPATLVVHNADGFMHDIVIPDLDVAAVRVAPGADAVVELPATAAGTYTIYCSLHSDTSVDDPQEAGMAAALVVR